MNGSLSTEHAIRQYLLGKLNDQDTLEDSLSLQILADDELSDIADVIEDEIIEDYLDGTLSATDKKAVEEYFLTPVERKEKLRLAKLLRDHLASKAEVFAEKTASILSDANKRATGKEPFSASPARRSYLRTYCEIAVLALICVLSFIYIKRVRYGLQSQIDVSQENQARVEDQLAQERSLSAGLTERLEELQPPVATLTFSASVFRGLEARSVKIWPFTQRIRVTIVGVFGDGCCDVRLETRAGRQIWTQAGITPTSGGLQFEVPNHEITTGDYRLVVSSQARERSYLFRAEAGSQPH
jgi:anti-sigma factor RsiW